NGFLSKEMFFTAALSVKELAIFSLETWGILFPIIAWIASVFTFVYSMIIVFKTFLGTYRGETIAKKDIEPPVGMLIPPVILAFSHLFLHKVIYLSIRFLLGMVGLLKYG